MQSLTVSCVLRANIRPTREIPRSLIAQTVLLGPFQPLKVQWTVTHAKYVAQESIRLLEAVSAHYVLPASTLLNKRHNRAAFATRVRKGHMHLTRGTQIRASVLGATQGRIRHKQANSRQAHVRLVGWVRIHPKSVLKIRARA